MMESLPFGLLKEVNLLGLSALDTGARAGRFMKCKRKYSAEPIGPLEMVGDFLPPPDQLVLKDAGVKITISVSQRSINFFKAHAAQSRVSYQRMIRSLLDSYASRFGDQALTAASNARAGGKVQK